MTSTIKVNNVQNQCGQNIINENSNTITIGASGDTIALASGASQTGFGRTGTVDWQTTPKTATFTAVSGEGYFCNTSGGAFTVNLPAGSAGAIVSLADYAGTFQTNNLTIAANGSEKIGGSTIDVTLNTEGQSVTLVYVDSTQGWVTTADSSENVVGNAFICASVSGACNTLVTAPDCANAKIATFLGPGTFTVNSAAACATNNIVSYMVIAGGGGAGSERGAGGGAGGFREVVSPSAPYTGSPLDGYPTPANRVTVTATAFPITVGAGGTISGSYPPYSYGNRGSDSIFSTITSTGGGGGAGALIASPEQPGGSGGGGAHNPSIPGVTGQTGGAGNTTR